MVIYSGVLFLIFCGLILVGSKRENDEHSSFMSIKETTCVKGIMAIEVMLCHIYAYYNEGYAMKLFNAFAYIAVAIFFLFTGYGLVYSTKHKVDYLTNFLSVRLKKMYIPLWVSLVFSFLLRALFQVEREYSFGIVCQDLLGLNAIWFFAVIVLYYILFYVVWKFVDQKYTVGVMMFLTAMQCVICYILQMNKHYFTSSFGFVLGMLLAVDFDNKYAFVNKISEWCKTNKVRVIFMFAIVGIVAGGLYIICHDNAFWGQLIMRNVMGLIIVFIILLFLYNVQIGNKVTYFLGRCSYEIFLIHPVVITSIRAYGEDKHSSTVQVILIWIFTIVTAYIIHILSVWVLNVSEGIFKRRYLWKK